jgi:hypothetical protein
MTFYFICLFLFELYTFIYCLLNIVPLILLLLSRHTKNHTIQYFIIRYRFHFIFLYYATHTHYTNGIYCIYLFLLFFFVCCRCCCWYRWCFFLCPLTFFTDLCFLFRTKIITDIKNFT